MEPSWGLGDGLIMTSTPRDMTTLIKAVGSGKLLSKSAASQQVEDLSKGLPGAPTQVGYGLGVVLANGWVLQNPVFNGYAGIAAYLPPQQISIVIDNADFDHIARAGRTSTDSAPQVVADGARGTVPSSWDRPHPVVRLLRLVGAFLAADVFAGLACSASASSSSGVGAPPETATWASCSDGMGPPDASGAPAIAERSVGVGAPVTPAASALAAAAS